MRDRVKIVILVVLAVMFIGFFMFYDVGDAWGYVIPRRGEKVLAIILTGAAIAFSTVIFQTITNNKILTPSIIGLDSLYVLIQTVIVFVLGSTTLTMLDDNVHFIISVGLMVLFAGLLFKILFNRAGRNVYFLLLVGFIFGTLFESLSSFMGILIDPNEFFVIRDKMFASFNNINTNILYLSIVIVLVVTAYFTKFAKFLDVMSLGKEHAVNLGVDYDAVVKRLLVIIAILVSVATALVGPITFLGLIVANVAYQFLHTYQHQFLITAAILISIIALVGGQFIIEEVFVFSTTISVIINLVGGVYFLYLLLKERPT